MGTCSERGPPLWASHFLLPLAPSVSLPHRAAVLFRPPSPSFSPLPSFCFPLSCFPFLSSTLLCPPFLSPRFSSVQFLTSSPSSLASVLRGPSPCPPQSLSSDSIRKLLLASRLPRVAEWQCPSRWGQLCKPVFAHLHAPRLAC